MAGTPAPGRRLRRQVRSERPAEAGLFFLPRLVRMTEIRDLTTLQDADAALGVAVATWGDHQNPPRELLRAFQASGNLLQGAFRDGQMVGFSLGFFGRDDDGSFHLHSHMVAVLPELRAEGIGFELKMEQRSACLAAGVLRIRWTFDPLISRNAYFNLSKLGAVADRFDTEFYGSMEDDLNSGDRSDRLWARWDLDRAVPEPSAVEGAAVVLDRGDQERPVEGEAPRGSALVRIPREYASLRERDPELAMEWRAATARALVACFGAGLIATRFLSDSTYVFEEE